MSIELEKDSWNIVNRIAPTIPFKKSEISVEDGFKTIISGGILDSGKSLSSKIKI